MAEADVHGDEVMNDAIENVILSEMMNDSAPAPECVPGDFTVRLGDVMPAWVMKGLEEEFAKFGGAAEAVSGFLSAMHWVEEEVRGVDDLLEGLGRLKGALMAVGATVEGKW